MLRGAAPANCRAARPTVTRVGLVPVEEPERSSRSPMAEIRVADGTQKHSNECQPNAELHSNAPDSCSNRTTHINQLNSSKKTFTLRIASYFYGPPRTGRGLGETDVTIRPDWTGSPSLAEALPRKDGPHEDPVQLGRTVTSVSPSHHPIRGGP